MVGNKESGCITFYYDNKELFNDVGILSAYMTKNLAIEKGSLLDEYALTDDEWDIYKICLQQALPNIYEHMLKLSSGIADAFNAEATVEEQEEYGLERKPGTYVEINIQDNAAYNENVLTLVDATLHNCLKYGILSEFYATNIHAELLAMARNKYAENIKMLNQRMFQLKKRQMPCLR